MNTRSEEKIDEWWCENGHLNEDQRDFLKQRLEEIRPKNTLETGTSTGRGSATILCFGSPEKHVSVDLSLDGAEGCHHNRSFVNKMIEYFDNFKHFEGDSRVVLSEDFFDNEFPDGIDFFFVDGGHTYDVAYSDMKAGWPNINKGGMMIVDDYRSGPPNGAALPSVTSAVDDFARDNNLQFEPWNKDGKGFAIFSK